MSELSKQALLVDNNQSFPNNNAGAITPSVLRAFNTNMIDSTVNQTVFNAFSSSVESEFASLTASVDPSITGSSLITASFDNSTRNLTFTKGDSTTFNVNIPDVSGSTINTGSFAITGSNTFTGNQTINGTLIISGAIGTDLIQFGPTNTPVVRFRADTGLTLFTSGGIGIFNLDGGGNIVIDQQAGTGGIFLRNLTGGVVSLSGSATSIQDVDFIPFSASLNTRILAITGSGGTINTGSFATTGSNTFVADQTVSASILVTGNVEMNKDVNAGVFFPMDGGKSVRIQKQVGINRLSWVAEDNAKLLYLDLDTDAFFVSGGFQAGLQNGYAWVGQADGYSGQVPTSSFSGGGNVSVQDEGTILGNATSFNFNGAGVTATLSAGTASITIPGGGGSIDTGSFATTGSNVFVGNQTIQNANLLMSGSILFPNGTELRGNSSQQTLLYSPTSSLLVGSAVNLIITASQATIESSTFNTLTAPRTDIRGAETIGDITGTGVGEVYLLGRSGSLILGNSNTATYAGISHYSSSAVNGNTNLIFKSNNTATSLTISGSDNLISNPSTATPGFRRFIGSGGGNITIGTSGTNIPQISGSMAFPIAMNNNYIAGVLQSRGPVSSSQWNINSNLLPGTIIIGPAAITNAEKLVSGLNLTSNIVAGTLSIVANQSFISTSVALNNNNINGTVTLQLSSSALTMNNNSINDSAFSFVNQFSSGAVGVGQPQMNVNTVGGAQNTFLVTGSQLGAGLAPAFNQNLLLGTANTLFVNASAARVNGANIYHNAFANALLGQRLIASGSSNTNDVGSFGSVFVGRNNANDGIRNKTSDIIFAVGTGISSSADTRKTGFLIDSGSNTFVEGTLNVSGSTSTTGSITIQSGSGDLFVHGHKQFNVGAFSSLVTQSGSANVSQSVQFDTTDYSSGITLQSGSQILVANSGVYSLTFSAQCDPLTGAGDLYVWLKKNGTNVANSTTRLSLANNDSQLMTVNFVVDATANDYYELCWESDTGDVILETFAATGNIPATPSVILTITQVR